MRRSRRHVLFPLPVLTVAWFFWSRYGTPPSAGVRPEARSRYTALGVFSYATRLTLVTMLGAACWVGATWVTAGGTVGELFLLLGPTTALGSLLAFSGVEARAVLADAVGEDGRRWSWGLAAGHWIETTSSLMSLVNLAFTTIGFLLILLGSGAEQKALGLYLILHILWVATCGTPKEALHFVIWLSGDKV